jgi:hypothetical protein
MSVSQNHRNSFGIPHIYYPLPSCREQKDEEEHLNLKPTGQAILQTAVNAGLNSCALTRY